MAPRGRGPHACRLATLHSPRQRRRDDGSLLFQGGSPVRDLTVHGRCGDGDWRPAAGVSGDARRAEHRSRRLGDRCHVNRPAARSFEPPGSVCPGRSGVTAHHHGEPADRTLIRLSSIIPSSRRGCDYVLAYRDARHGDWNRRGHGAAFRGSPGAFPLHPWRRTPSLATYFPFFRRGHGEVPGSRTDRRSTRPVRDVILLRRDGRPFSRPTGSAMLARPLFRTRPTPRAPCPRGGS